MPKRMNFKGAHIPSSAPAQELYWKVVSIGMDLTTPTITYTIYGFESKAAADANQQPIPGAMKTNTVSGAEAVAMVEANKPNGVYAKLQQQIWEHAMNKKEGQPPAAGQPDTRKSFFDGAVETA